MSYGRSASFSYDIPLTLQQLYKVGIVTKVLQIGRVILRNVPEGQVSWHLAKQGFEAVCFSPAPLDAAQSPARCDGCSGEGGTSHDTQGIFQQRKAGRQLAFSSSGGRTCVFICTEGRRGREGKEKEKVKKVEEGELQLEDNLKLELIEEGGAGGKRRGRGRGSERREQGGEGTVAHCRRHLTKLRNSILPSMIIKVLKSTRKGRCAILSTFKIFDKTEGLNTH